MQPITILVAVALVAFFLWVVVKAQMAGRRKGDYYLRKSLFTPAERAFLPVLERAMPAGLRVFGKVRLEDIFGVKSGLDLSERQAARNKVSRKHVDFLLVRDDDFAPVAGIELDDSSHEADDRRERDKFVDAAFAGAGLPLLHVPVQQTYHPAELKRDVIHLVSRR